MKMKELENLYKAIKSILSFIGLKTISDMVIQVTFGKGWDSSEKQIERNVIVDNNAVSFIQDYTFNNIKGMTEEIMQDLRQELERGIMNGDAM